MNKILIVAGILVSAFVFSIGIQTVFANTPTWYSNEMADKQINMMLCSVPIDLTSNIMPDKSLAPSKPAKKSTTDKNNFSILTTYSIRQISLINGDVDDDNYVGGTDYDAMIGVWGTTSEDEDFNPNADLNGDESVDFYDFIIWNANYDTNGD